MEENSEKIKIVLLGTFGGGKSSIAQKYVNNEFDSDVRPTVGSDYFTKSVKYEDKFYELSIFDTSGQEKFKALTPSYYRDADAALLVCDCTSKNSVDDVQMYLEELSNNNNKNLV